MCSVKLRFYLVAGNRNSSQELDLHVLRTQNPGTGTVSVAAAEQMLISVLDRKYMCVLPIALLSSHYGELAGRKAKISHKSRRGVLFSGCYA